MKVFNPHTEDLSKTAVEQMCAVMDEREHCECDNAGRRTVKMSHDWGCWHDQWGNSTAHMRSATKC